MTASAPPFRSVCQFTGEAKPQPIALVRARSEADAFCAENVKLRRLRDENERLRESVNALGYLLQQSERRIAELTSGAALAAEVGSAADEEAAADHPTTK